MYLSIVHNTNTMAMLKFFFFRKHFGQTNGNMHVQNSSLVSLKKLVEQHKGKRKLGDIGTSQGNCNMNGQFHESYIKLGALMK